MTSLYEWGAGIEEWDPNGLYARMNRLMSPLPPPEPPPQEPDPVTAMEQFDLGMQPEPYAPLNAGLPPADATSTASAAPLEAGWEPLPYTPPDMAVAPTLEPPGYEPVLPGYISPAVAEPFTGYVEPLPSPDILPPEPSTGGGLLGGIQNFLGDAADIALDAATLPFGGGGQQPQGLPYQDLPGAALDLYNTDIPYYSDFARNTLIPAVGEVYERAPVTGALAGGIAALSDLTGIGNVSAGDVSRGLAEATTPVTLGDVAVELSPFGVAGDVGRAVRGAGMGVLAAPGRMFPAGGTDDLADELIELTARINANTASPRDMARAQELLSMQDTLASAPFTPQPLTPEVAQSTALRESYDRGEFISPTLRGTPEPVTPESVQGFDQPLGPEDLRARLREMTAGAPRVQQQAPGGVSAGGMAPNQLPVDEGNVLAPPAAPPGPGGGTTAGVVSPPPPGPPAVTRGPGRGGGAAGEPPAPPTEAVPTPPAGRATSFIQNLPNELRQLTAGLDLSNMLRQGWGTIRHGPEYLSSAASGARGAIDESYALARNAELKAGNRPGLFLADLAREGPSTMAGREENYAGELVGQLPGFRQSANGNTLFLNEQRSRVFDTVKRAWDRAEEAQASGRAGPLQRISQAIRRPGDEEALGRYISRTTGRGTLGPAEGTWLSDIMGLGLFSPRFQLSRIQGPASMFNLRNPRVAVEAIKDYAASTTATISLLALANESGLADVNLDPTSSDFGKFRIGPVRIDPWAGHQQLATLVARLKSGAGAEGFEDEAKRLLLQQLRYKASPLAGRTWDLITGKDALGRDVTPESFAAAFLPIFLQGIYEGAQEGLLGETLATVPATFFGLGAQAYNPTPYQALEEGAGKAGADWGNMLGHEQYELLQQRPELQPLYDAYVNSREGTSAVLAKEKADALSQIAPLARTNPAGYREAANDIAAKNAIAYEQARRDGKIKDFTGEQGEAQKAVDGYYAEISKARDRLTGQANYELQDKLAADYLEKLSPQMQDKVMREVTFAWDPTYREYKEARQRLNPLFKADDKALEQFQQQVGKNAPAGSLAAKSLQYDTMEEFTQEITRQARADANAARVPENRLEYEVARAVDAWKRQQKLDEGRQYYRARTVFENPALMDDLRAWYPEQVSQYLLKAEQDARR